MSKENMGASPDGDRAVVNGAGQAVSAVPASVPSAWSDWQTSPPEHGQKVVIVCDDGCSSSLALITDEGALDGEDAFPLGEDFLRGAIWLPLPDSYQLAFMEQTVDDWF